MFDHEELCMYQGEETEEYVDIDKFVDDMVEVFKHLPAR